MGLFGGMWNSERVEEKWKFEQASILYYTGSVPLMLEEWDSGKSIGK